jgi:chromatin modification-related protein EAF6
MPPRKAGAPAQGITTKAGGTKSSLSTCGTNELEKKRLQVADELSKVEQQIYDLETKYLEQSTPFGNAIKGYEGFLGGVGQPKKVTIKPEDRIFSGSFSK